MANTEVLVFDYGAILHPRSGHNNQSISLRIPSVYCLFVSATLACVQSLRVRQNGCGISLHSRFSRTEALLGIAIVQGEARGNAQVRLRHAVL